MKTAIIVAAGSMALLSSQALAENWVTLGGMGQGTSFGVDKDSIRRGSDGLVRFTDRNSLLGKSNAAADCTGRILYDVEDYKDQDPEWRKSGHSVDASSIGGIELQHVCAYAP
jgi:hypothetical protein